MLDQCPGVIQQHLDRDTTEQQESFLHPGEPVGLAFPQRRPDMDPSRVAERGDEQMDPQSLVPDPHPRLAEVDLQLMARRRLEPNRRPRRRLQLATPTRNTALDMAKAHRDPMFGRQRSEEHTSELQSLMRNSYAVFCL